MTNGGWRRYQNIVQKHENIKHLKLRNSRWYLLKGGAYLSSQAVPDGIDVRTNKGAIHGRLESSNRHVLRKVELLSCLHCAEDGCTVPVNRVSIRLGVFSRSRFDVPPVVFIVVQSVGAFVFFNSFGDRSVGLAGVGAWTVVAHGEVDGVQGSGGGRGS